MLAPLRSLGFWFGIYTWGNHRLPLVWPQLGSDVHKGSTVVVGAGATAPAGNPAGTVPSLTKVLS